MKKQLNEYTAWAEMRLAIVTVVTVFAAPVLAQVPVDENGATLGQYEEIQSSAAANGNEDIPLLSTVDLEELVGPIALYPDDLLAVVLPAAAYPLQIIDAARFLEALENDPSLQPDPDWDDAVVALLNYPEVVELLNDDIDWTWRLGEAVVSQQADVVAAIETFRDRAYAAGNLKSDSHQNVSRNGNVIEITPVVEDEIYVPYYEPERVVVYQPRPVYYYYPRPYPLYYYPYASSYAFDRGYFWGVTTAFTIGWYSDSLNVFHQSYYGHPYYGRSYYDRWWYRRPTINVYNSTYIASNRQVTVNHFNRGDHWRPRQDRRDYVGDRRSPRNRDNPRRRSDNVTRPAQGVNTVQRSATALGTQRGNTSRREHVREPIAFRQRPQTAAVSRSGRSTTVQRSARNVQPGAGAAARVQPSATPRTTQRRQDLRPDNRDVRAAPAARLRSAEPTTRTRPTERARQGSRVERAANVRAAEPASVARRTQSTPQARRSVAAQPAPSTAGPAPQRRPDSARATGRSEPVRQRTERRNDTTASGTGQSGASKPARRKEQRK